MDPIALLKAAILGIVEGVTEFLPISSTGHLLVAERILGYHDPGAVFTVVIQLGAILAVCWHYRVRIARLCLHLHDDARERRFAGLVLLATAPAALVGIPLDKFLEAHVFTEAVAPAVVAATFAVGGLAILLIERRRTPATVATIDDLAWKAALIIGCCQLLAAAFPGLSRSGATIMGALLIGVARPAATEFSFWLAMPALFGAAVLKLAKHHDALDAARAGELAVGFVVAFISALVVIRWLLRFVAGHDFTAFAWYRIIAGVLLAAALAAGVL
jgi:undecaprenyl-diphosphatase